MNKPLLNTTEPVPGTILPRLHRGRSLWAGVSIALTQKDVEAVLQHRYEVYVADRGMNYPGLDHTARILRDTEDDDAILLNSKDTTGNVTASMRIRLQHCGAVKDTDQASFIKKKPSNGGQNHVAHLARMCASDKRRANPQLLRMMLFAYFFGLNNGVRIAFLHSRSSHQSLYEHLGYHAIGLGRDGVIPMAISLRNRERLQEVRSPYQSILSLLEATAQQKEA